MDDDILGPPRTHTIGIQKLAKMFLDEIPNHESGLSGRQMHKLHPDIETVTWMKVGMWLFGEGKVNHEWRALKQPNHSAQESVYTLKTDGTPRRP